MDDDAGPLGTKDLATHHISLDEAPAAYRTSRERADGMIEAVVDAV